MLVIRLQRTGRRNAPAYRIVVAEHSAPVKGKVNEIIGHYLPTRNPAEFTCQQDRVTYWVSLGAKPTNTVARLLLKDGMKGLEKFTKTYTIKKKKNAPDEPTPPPPVAQAPVEAAPEPTKEEIAPVEVATKEEVSTEEITPEAPKEETEEVIAEEKAEEEVKEPEEKKEGDNEEKDS